MDNIALVLGRDSGPWMSSQETGIPPNSSLVAMRGHILKGEAAFHLWNCFKTTPHPFTLLDMPCSLVFGGDFVPRFGSVT